MKDGPLICAWTVTCNRPELLGRTVKCFERQTYANKFLVILDDLGQYENQKGDRWELVSVTRRFMSLGEKNVACMGLAPRDTWGYVKMDDDDFYMPHYIESHAEALSQAWWCQPRVAIDYHEGRMVRILTYNASRPDHFAYHGCWGYRREFIEKYGSYHPKYAGDDGDFQDRLIASGATKEHPSIGLNAVYYHPAYIYNRPLANRISERGGSAEAYWRSAPAEPKWIGKVPTWEDESDWKLEVPRELIARPW